MRYSEAVWHTGLQSWNPVDLIGALVLRALGR